MLSIKRSVSSRRSARSVTSMRCGRNNRRAHHVKKDRRCAPVAGKMVIFGPVAGKVDKNEIFNAALIRNRAVLEELSKH